MENFINSIIFSFFEIFVFSNKSKHEDIICINIFFSENNVLIILSCSILLDKSNIEEVLNNVFEYIGL
jgi:hypothetical protein